MPRVRTYGLDIDTMRYAQRVKSGSGTTILPEPLKQINKFVVGVKKLGLWNSMVCWPMRSIHNAGTGSTVYSLGGQGEFNGTMVNAPIWNSNGSGIFFDSTVNYKRVNIPVTTLGWTQASLCSIFRSTRFDPFTLLVTLDNPGASNDFNAKLSLSIFQSNGHTLFRSMGLTGGTNNRFAMITTTPTQLGFNYYFGQTNNIYDPANGNYLVQINSLLPNIQGGTGDLPYTAFGTDSFLCSTYGTVANRADTAAFSAIFRKTLGVNTSNMFRQLFRGTLGIGLNLP